MSTNKVNSGSQVKQASSHNEKLFEKFIRQFETDAAENLTHTLIGHPFKKYIIPDDRLEEFYGLYDQASKSKNYHMTEQRAATSPLLIDLDFKHSVENHGRHYTIKMIKKIINLYNKFIEEYVDFEGYEQNELLEVFVFEKPAPDLHEGKGRVSDGVHIMYPYLCLSHKLAHKIRESVIAKTRKKEYFKDMPLLNDLNDVFDKGVVDKVNWCLYGSSKPAGSIYKLTHIYAINDGKLVDVYNDKIKEIADNLSEVLSVRKFNNDEIVPAKKNILVEDKVLAIEDKPAKSAKQNMSIEDKLIAVAKEVLEEKKNNNDPIADLDTVKTLCGMLSRERASVQYDWIRVGWCLHNISVNLLDLWIEFSKRTTIKNQFKPGECEKLWRNFKDEGYTIKSLYHWARCDNPAEYAEFKESIKSKLVKKNIDCSHFDMASILHGMYRDVYVCVSFRHNSWFEFKDHKWSDVEGATTLYNKISTELVNMYLKLIRDNSNEALQSEDQEQRNALFKKNDVNQKIINRLKDASFKEGIMKECRHLFFNDKFLEKLDENRDLLCFTNGVLDLTDGNVHFRAGMPDDYISLCTNIPYVKFDPNHETIKDIFAYMEQVHIDKEMRDYVWLLLSSFLQGHTPDEKMHLCTGTGANSKSKLIEIVASAMGDYAITLPIQLLTGKRSASNAASPEVARSKGRRFGIFQEPEENDKIQVGLMKELTGGDKIMARALFKEPVEFKPQFKLLLTCNKLPDIPSNDGGTWRRLRVIQFKSRFVDNPDPKDKYQFEKDDGFSQKVEKNQWKKYFMSILVEKFVEYKKNKLIEPEEVTRFTNNYRATSDVYLEFINDRFEKTDSKKDAISINDMFSRFREWFKETYSDKKVPVKKELTDYMKAKFAEEIKNGHIIGYTYKENEGMDQLDNL